MCLAEFFALTKISGKFLLSSNLTGAGEWRRRYDAVIIGGGHNGLTCGAYLARAGLKTLVLERRPVIGGAAVSEEVCRASPSPSSAI